MSSLKVVSRLVVVLFLLADPILAHEPDEDVLEVVGRDFAHGFEADHSGGQTREGFEHRAPPRA